MNAWISSAVSRARRSITLIVRTLFFIVPFIVFFLVAHHYTLGFFQESPLKISYTAFVGAIGLSATLSALSLRASSSCPDSQKRTIFYNEGERLFHSTLLFGVALVIHFGYAEIGAGTTYRKLASTFVSFPGILFFFYGAVYASQALMGLHTVLFKGHEKPLD